MGDVYADVHFPVAGLDLSGPYSEQRPRPLPQGEEDDPGVPYGRTCAVGKNVRCIEASTLRRRGGSRPGTAKYIAGAVGGITDWMIQELASVVTSDASAEA